MRIKKVQFEGYEISAVHEQKYKSKWGALKDNQYRIYVKNLKTEEKCSFRFWNSNTVYRPIKTNYELIGALDCFISDAISATYSFEEFCDEFGYDRFDDYYDGYNKEAKRIHNACKRSYQSAIRVFGNDDEIYRVGNATRDLENGDYELEEKEIV